MCIYNATLKSIRLYENRTCPVGKRYRFKEVSLACPSLGETNASVLTSLHLFFRVFATLVQVPSYEIPLKSRSFGFHVRGAIRSPPLFILHSPLLTRSFFERLIERRLILIQESKSGLISLITTFLIVAHTNNKNTWLHNFCFLFLFQLQSSCTLSFIFTFLLFLCFVCFLLLLAFYLFHDGWY